MANDRFELRRLDAADDDALFAALTPEIWRLATTAFGRSRGEFEAYLDVARRQVQEGAAEVFTVLFEGNAVGMTRLFSIDPIHRGCELGYTWYREDLWGGGVNALCKLWVLRRAFEELGMIRVFFRIDARNTRSQAAVAKIGATREGVLRKDRINDDGHVRDTVVFSILDDEWPRVKAGLTQRVLAMRP